MFVLLLFPIFWACTDHGLNEEDRDKGITEGEVTAKQPKKKRPPKRTVEQNLSNINSAETERKCEVWYHFWQSRLINRAFLF